jgi:hypothetical protein
LKEAEFPEYKGDIRNYLFWVGDFERKKGYIWDDQTLRVAMLSTLPMEIMTFVIESHGRIPKDKEKFIETVKDIAECLETMDGMLLLQARRLQREQVRKYEEAKKRGRKLPSVWKNGRKAFKNVPQDEISRYKKEGRNCFRCGRMSHRWFQCVEYWSKEGTNLRKDL